MSRIEIDNVSLRFRRHHKVSGLKEFVLNKFRSGIPQQSSEDFWALRNIHLKMEEGTRLGLIGANGAGKSSLLKVISRIYAPTEGRIEVSGRVAPIIEIGAGFNPELTGRENVFLNGSILGIPRKILESRIQSIVNFSELADFIDTPVKYYSTGMGLRLAFTVATEVSPDILILDELYAGGDFHFIGKANQRLDSFVRESKILILVAHNMEYVRRFCNRVVVLDGGQIVCDGEPEEAIAHYMSLQANLDRERPVELST